jgi:hypothetical protein
MGLDGAQGPRLLPFDEAVPSKLGITEIDDRAKADGDVLRFAVFPPTAIQAAIGDHEATIYVVVPPVVDDCVLSLFAKRHLVYSFVV